MPVFVALSGVVGKRITLVEISMQRKISAPKQ
jgi:hypothetical protein